MQKHSGILLRIDDRLIHGQVVTTWVQYVGAKRIFIVSDRAVAEPLEVILLKSSVPRHLLLEVWSMQTALDQLVTTFDTATIILVERVADALTLCKHFSWIRHVNVGGLRYQPDRHSLNRAVYVTPEDVVELLEIEELGVEVSLQIVPSDAKVALRDRLPIRG